MPRPQKKSSGMGFCLVFAIALAVLVLGAGAFLLVTLKPAAPSTDPLSSDSAGIALPLPEFNILPTCEDFSRTAVPTVILPADAERYFAVVWNLDGTPEEKAGQFARAVPPAGLAQAHAAVSKAYKIFGDLDHDLLLLQKKWELEKCDKNSSAICTQLVTQRITIQLQRDAAYSDLLDVWTKTCVIWSDYYEQIGARFPYLDGRCKYP